MAKRKKTKEQREQNEAHRAMVDAMAYMVDVMTCPVDVAGEHAEHCDELVRNAERASEVAAIARRLHAGSSELQTALGGVLDEFRAAIQRFTAEMAVLRTRFEALEDHDVEHDHLDPDVVPIRELGDAMFGRPEDEPSED